ncbi:MAG: hypothetical protein COV60_01655 [Candidatus Magasanikbacteria bacterium CG11_big_fil_rev_8_21_14_0_20_43_7]|uniref:Uncharacterized protein n=1 Tax=Candidatus Magasanikbacteria bacterium CG11_big_fil_rev_8_21_14_0_20_43_7 TaxID=1974654 RepID=A0A2H0N2S5_9BACT|nr:MAG: hypothetical protein COV60_01655 [Candidatus Magasanikbacteria bacterium CG11_big_fil_rev_8_21_14_0_20_43_7]
MSEKSRGRWRDAALGLALSAGLHLGAGTAMVENGRRHRQLKDDDATSELLPDDEPEVRAELRIVGLHESKQALQQELAGYSEQEKANTDMGTFFLRSEYAIGALPKEQLDAAEQRLDEIVKLIKKDMPEFDLFHLLHSLSQPLLPDETHTRYDVSASRLSQRLRQDSNNPNAGPAADCEGHSLFTIALAQRLLHEYGVTEKYNVYQAIHGKNSQGDGHASTLIGIANTDVFFNIERTGFSQLRPKQRASLEGVEIRKLIDSYLGKRVNGIFHAHTYGKNGLPQKMRKSKKSTTPENAINRAELAYNLPERTGEANLETITYTKNNRVPLATTESVFAETVISNVIPDRDTKDAEGDEDDGDKEGADDDGEAALFEESPSLQKKLATTLEALPQDEEEQKIQALLDRGKKKLVAAIADKDSSVKELYSRYIRKDLEKQIATLTAGIEERPELAPQRELEAVGMAMHKIGRLYRTEPDRSLSNKTEFMEYMQTLEISGVLDKLRLHVLAKEIGDAIRYYEQEKKVEGLLFSKEEAQKIILHQATKEKVLNTGIHIETLQNDFPDVWNRVKNQSVDEQITFSSSTYGGLTQEQFMEIVDTLVDNKTPIRELFITMTPAIRDLSWIKKLNTSQLELVNVRGDATNGNIPEDLSPLRFVKGPLQAIAYNQKSRGVEKVLEYLQNTLRTITITGVTESDDIRFLSKYPQISIGLFQPAVGVDLSKIAQASNLLKIYKTNNPNDKVESPKLITTISINGAPAEKDIGSLSVFFTKEQIKSGVFINDKTLTVEQKDAEIKEGYYNDTNYDWLTLTELQELGNDAGAKLEIHNRTKYKDASLDMLVEDAKSGDAWAVYEMKERHATADYEDGEKIKQKLDTVRRYIEEHAKEDDAERQWTLSKIYDYLKYYKNENYKYLELASAEKAAHYGMLKAQKFLALELRIGVSFPPNENQALRWLKKAAEAGDPESLYDLAQRIYISGDDDTKIRELLESAADKKYPKAMFEYAKSCYYGFGVPEDKKEAKKYFLQFIESSKTLTHSPYEVHKAYFLLGRITEDEGDEPLAKAYYQMAFGVPGVAEEIIKNDKKFLEELREIDKKYSAQ